MDSQTLKEHLDEISTSPGVYCFYDAKDALLYVGKARNLKKRLTTYAQGRFHGYMALVLRQSVRFETTLTASDVDALLLEASFIQKRKPLYNIRLRDNSMGLFVSLSKDDFTRITKVRSLRQGKDADYFGPFLSSQALKKGIDTLQRAFLLRSCSNAVFSNRSRPCLLYQIQRCCAPCVGKTSQEQYKKLASQARAFFRGAHKKVQNELAKTMEEKSQTLAFEEAALYRNRLHALSKILTHTSIQAKSFQDGDLVALVVKGRRACVYVSRFRETHGLGGSALFPSYFSGILEERVLESFLMQFYKDFKPAPILFTNILPTRKKLIEQALSAEHGYAISIRVPQRKDVKLLMRDVENNADNALRTFVREQEQKHKKSASLLTQLQDAFNLPNPLKRIEIYDNSHLRGTYALGAMVVATPEGFEKESYRTFHIQDANTQDDLDMMREVFRRRFRLSKRNETPFPDLVLIDGGPTQVKAAFETLQEIGVSLSLVGIAKGRERNAGRETFCTPLEQHITLEFDSPLIHYLQRLRDEAHRFVIQRHRARRSKHLSRSTLEDVKGIGALKKRQILAHFGSFDRLASARIEQLQAVPGIGEKIAHLLWSHFHSK